MVLENLISLEKDFMTSKEVSELSSRNKEVGIKQDMFKNMEGPLKMISDLLGGTSDMRNASTIYLPKWEGEDLSDYMVRLNRTFLFSGLKKILRILTSKPFSKSTVYKDYSPLFLEWFDDIDTIGTSANIFLRKLLWSSIADGVTLIAVDMPKTVDINGDSIFQNLRQQQLFNIRPYMIHIDVRNVLGIRTYMDGNLEKLEHIRLAEKEIVSDGMFGSKKINRVRVLYQGYYQLWEQEEKSDYFILVEEGIIGINEIPIVPIYSNQIELFQAKPPLEEVAWKNIELWQDGSDQNNSLAFARIPLLALIGVGTQMGTIKIAPNSKIELKDPQAKIQMVEHSGRAIEAGEKNAQRIKDEMEIMGIQYVSKVVKTATQRIMDDEDEMSELKSWVIQLEEGFDQACKFMAQFMGISDSELGKVDIHKEYDIGIGSTEDMKVLADMQKRGVLDKETELDEAKRRRILSDDTDIEEIMLKAKIEQESFMDSFGSQINPSGLGNNNNQNVDDNQDLDFDSDIE